MRRLITFNARKGQLQIAETLIAVSLMLVLALLLISAAELSLSPSSELSNLDQTASDILATADEGGLLRPVVYLLSSSKYETEFLSYQNLLDDYISSVLSQNIDYAMIAHEIVNGTIKSEYSILIGSPANIGALQQGGEGVIANYYLGSFTSATFGQYSTQFFVQLYLWEKI
ncbi:MAG: hypothetical protein ACFE9L_04130 [Candidatus Hodarchaeota archaeon]